MSPSLRARVLADWRGLPETPFPRHTAKPIGETIEKVMASLGLSDRLREDQILKAWSDVVGEFIASHSAPHRLKDGVLYVHVLQSAVHFELDRVWKREILEKFKSRFGARAIRDIKFRIG